MKTWVPSAIIYQVNLRGLCAREPRNAFEAAREKPLKESPLAYVARNLSLIRKLGANVVYFMPPYPIGFDQRKGIGSPYASRDFRAIEPEYGSLEEMAALVRKAHALGLKVIFDITPNHTSRDHVWISRHPEFYVKRDNGEIFFDCDWSDTAKLDYTQPALREAMLSVYDYWLGFLGKDQEGNPDGVDGFRLDMAHFINDKSFWNEAIPELRKRHASRELLFLAECYGLGNNVDLFDRGINAAYDDDFYKVCQYLYGLDPQGHTRLVPDRELDRNESFRDRYDAFLAGGIAGAFARALLNYEERYGTAPNPPRLARYTDNHDEGRGMYLYGEGAVRAVNQLIFMSHLTLPFLLTGEEFGAVNRPPIHDRMNPIGKRRRITTGSHTWDQESVEFEGNSFARGREKRAELYAFFRGLIQLRSRNKELIHGTFQIIEAGEDSPRHEQSVLAFDRTYRGSTVRCAVNLGPHPRKLNHADLFAGHVLHGGLADGGLPPFGAIATRVG